MTAKHTPGPWATVPPDAGGWAVQYHRMTSESVNGGYVSAMCPGPDAEANARLIAAAPALLEAARVALDRGVSHWDTCCIGWARDVCDCGAGNLNAKLRAAIAAVEPAPL